jgi:DNA-directed RNA polymerase subunit beta
LGLKAIEIFLKYFNLAEDVKVSKSGLKKIVGRKLAARVLKSWIEDFVDEDTGEVVSIERNEVIIEREVVVENDHIDMIIDSGQKSILIHKEDQNSADFDIIYNTLQKDPCNSEKEAVVHIYRQLRNAEPPDEATARDVIDKLFFSDKRYDLGEVGRYRINRKLYGKASRRIRK